MGIPAIPHLVSRSLKPRLPSARPASLTVSEGLYHRYGLHSHICRTAGHRVINTHPSQSTDVAFVVHFRHSYYRKMGAVQHLQVPCVTWCMSCSLAHYQYCTVTWGTGSKSISARTVERAYRPIHIMKWPRRREQRSES